MVFIFTSVYMGRRLGNTIRAPKSPGKPGGYHTYQEVIDETAALVAAHPSLVSRSQIATSHEGRPIFALKVSERRRHRPEPQLVVAVGLLRRFQRSAVKDSDLYIVDGAIDDWLWGQEGIFGFTLEMYPTGDSPGFYPPDEAIVAQTSRKPRGGAAAAGARGSPSRATAACA